MFFYISDTYVRTKVESESFLSPKISAKAHHVSPARYDKIRRNLSPPDLTVSHRSIHSILRTFIYLSAFASLELLALAVTRSKSSQVKSQSIEDLYNCSQHFCSDGLELFRRQVGIKPIANSSISSWIQFLLHVK